MKRIKAPSHLQNPKNPASCACRNQGSSSDLYSFCPDSVSHSVGHLHFSYHRSWPYKFQKTRWPWLQSFRKTLREPRENNENTHWQHENDTKCLWCNLPTFSDSFDRRDRRHVDRFGYVYYGLSPGDKWKSQMCFKTRRVVPRLLVLLLFRWTLLDDLLVLQSARINHDSESSSAEFSCQS